MTNVCNLGHLQNIKIIFFELRHDPHINEIEKNVSQKS